MYPYEILLAFFVGVLVGSLLHFLTQDEPADFDPPGERNRRADGYETGTRPHGA